MKLLLMIWMIFFLCLMSGEEKRQVPEINGDSMEVVIQDMQVSAEVSVSQTAPGWLKSCFFILNILDPVKQFDLSGDHDKSWYNLHSKLLRSSRNAEILIQQQTCHIAKYMRLLTARYINGFYIYSLEKLLI